MRKDLLLIEINECDFKYFQYGSKKYNYTFIKKFFLEKKKFTLIQMTKKRVLIWIHGSNGSLFIQANCQKIIKFIDWDKN